MAPMRGQPVEVEHGLMNLTQEQSLYRVGDTVLVMSATRPDGSQLVMITGYLRTRDMALLAGMLITFTILMSGRKGLRALVGLAISFIVVLGEEGLATECLRAADVAAPSITATLDWQPQYLTDACFCTNMRAQVKHLQRHSKEV